VTSRGRSRWTLGDAVKVWLLAGAAWLLAGCATLTPPTADAGAPHDPTLIEGRLAVQVQALGDQPAQSLAAPFTLQGDERAGSLALSTPIGTMLARAVWQPSVATLTTPQDTRQYPNLDAMADDLLGQAVPMAALLSWLRGQPWGGAAHTSTSTSTTTSTTTTTTTSNATASNAPPTATFTQLGWSVDLNGYAEGLVVAQRDTPPPRVTVRARIDRKP
jgi:outer membrane lipoprotein LolB